VTVGGSRPEAMAGPRIHPTDHFTCAPIAEYAVSNGGSGPEAEHPPAPVSASMARKPVKRIIRRPTPIATPLPSATARAKMGRLCNHFGEDQQALGTRMITSPWLSRGAGSLSNAARSLEQTRFDPS
jgi:hypothetical protein